MMKNPSTNTNNSRRINFAILLLTVILLTFISAANAKAQTVCYPDCPNTFWIPNPPAPPYTYQVTLPCGEPVVVSYRIRNACNQYWDLFIEGVTFVNGYTGGYTCGQTMTLKDMMQSVMTQMLVQNPMGFPPTDTTRDTCVYTYRVMLGACWKATFPINATHLDDDSAPQDPETDLPGGLIMPCLFIDCCIERYSVCIINHQRVITYNGGASTPGECDPDELPTCTPICE